MTEEQEHEAIDLLGICGCGSGEVVGFIAECMTQRRDDAPNLIDHRKITELVKKWPDVAAEFILHVLDDQGLTEHGSSVYGSWPTDAGKRFMQLAEED